MVIKYIDNVAFKKMVIGAAANLDNNKAIVDSLNVFPVPDGDTGTNMNLTVQSAIKEIDGLKDSTIEKISEAVANGSLMGARGNSGVILSQLFRGFAKGLKGVNKIDSIVLANAFKLASETAYKAVMKPVEGTILTVARETAQKAIETYEQYEDVSLFLENLIEQAKDTLARTPDMLKALKQADVVDAGGKGLVYIMEGGLAALKGIDIKVEKKETEIVETAQELSAFSSEDEIIYAYCTEFIIKNARISSEQFLRSIMDKGDSIVSVGANDIIKVHIHTNNPGQILAVAVKYGELIKIKIDNMKEQFREQQKNRENNKNKEKKTYGFVAIGMGDGIEKVFKDLNVDVFVSGGQTMNPSTEDIISATENINAEHIIILPNNSNIILAANQAKKVSKKNLHVIPSKTIPQGISAMLAFIENNEIDINIENMTEAIKNVKTGQITYAVRDTVFNDMEIKKDEIIALFDGEIVSHGQNIDEQVVSIVEKMVDEDSFVVTLFYGDSISQEDAEQLGEELSNTAPDCDIEIVKGNQPLYHYIISVE